jgi:Methane oxygenase PmoA
MSMKRLRKIIKTGTIIVPLVLFLIFSVQAQNKPVNFVSYEKNQKVDVLIDGKVFTSYIYPDDLDKPVLYPVHTAKGTVVTRGFPRDPRPGERVDHPHHVGIWFNYGDVNNLDFWNNSYAIAANEKDKYGTIRHQKIVKTENGKDKGTLIVQSHWIDSKGKILLNEETTFVFTGTDNLRTIDRSTKLTAQKESVVFEESKEGLLGIRVDRAFEEPSSQPEVFTDASGNPTTIAVLNNEGVNGVYRNSRGSKKGEVWGKRADWVSLSATKDSEPITIALIDNKKNMGYPAHWHARGYGLFAVNNLGSKSFIPTDEEFIKTLSPGETIEFNHRVLIQSGKFLSDEEMNHQFMEFNK